jgi:hypothetical protein
MKKQREIQQLVQKGKVGNLRVTNKALEFDIFVKDEDELHDAEHVFSKATKTLTVKRLDLPPTVPDKAKTITEARQLFNDERYWECHEILENLWRESKGDEKTLIQGIILVCAAFVHFQKNEADVALSMLQRYQPKLRWDDKFYEGVDLEKLRDGVAEIIRAKTLKPILM